MYYSNKPVSAYFYRERQTFTDLDPTVQKYFENWTASPDKFNSRSGGSSKDWKRAIAQRISASTGYSVEHWEVEKEPGYCIFDYTYKVTGRTYYNRILQDLTGFTNWPPFYAGDISDIDDQARTQFLSRCFRAQHTFQGGVFLGELREAVHMIRHPLDSLVGGMQQYLNALRRRKRKGIGHGRRLQKMIADTWLEYVFGWGPLLSDIDSGAQALANATTYRAPTKHVIGSAKKSEVVHGTYSDVISPDNQYYFVSYKPITKTEVEVKYIGGVYAKAGGDGISSNLADFGVDMRSFLPTLWELIPYSFLVDYISNVGQFVEGLSFMTSDLIYVTRTLKSTTERWASGFQTQNNIQHDDSFLIRNELFVPGSSRMAGSLYQRNDVLSSIGLPSLAFTLENLNFRRGANISALGAAAAATSRHLNS
ncbi:TPA_asm: maturation protein [ssRNA phage Esthiorhiza.4_2]|uniref:Maturation protein n=2 Tax=Norzivirales TaxID=2842247 RepID=A0A8S5L1W3_9VIRU|nr:maturation protein [ssRNA phage Esthiorhiza.4_2]QDH89347.1 MAG: hypothetical protein H4RhizoLitter19469_000004 [Leviviridae sp.]DAD51846.1 TPA_asm: maturation protein [ssRNA phage Esthiorhiza.4_2]